MRYYVSWQIPSYFYFFLFLFLFFNKISIQKNLVTFMARFHSETIGCTFWIQRHGLAF